jgi:glycine C-acetyltransferase
MISAMASGFKEDFDQKLDGIKKGIASGMYPFGLEFESAQDGEAVCESQNVVMLTSNNYLGLATHPEIKEAIKNAVDIYGSGTCGARLHNGTTALHKELERRCADYFHTEDAVILSAGYLANVAGISAMIDDSESMIITDQLNHMSIVDGITMSKGQVRIFEHNNMDKLEHILGKNKNVKKKMIVVDGVYSMDGDIAPLDKITELAEQYDASVFVDEAHTLGFVGENGRGACEHFHVEDKVHIKMTTFSKSLAGVGGCVASDADTCLYIRHNAHPYMFNASIPPAVAAGIIKAFDLMEREKWRSEKLWDNTIYFRRKLNEMGFNTLNSMSPIIPIFIGDDLLNMRITKRLFEEGVYIATAVYPAVQHNMSRLRATITASLERSQLDYALDKLYKVGKEYNVVK